MRWTPKIWGPPPIYERDDNYIGYMISLSLSIYNQSIINIYIYIYISKDLMPESMRSCQVVPFFDNLAILYFLVVTPYCLTQLSLSLSQLAIQNFKPFNCLPLIQLAIQNFRPFNCPPLSISFSFLLYTTIS